MSTAIKRRRGTTVQHSTFIGQPGEWTHDTDLKTIRAHDGVREGGYPVDYVLNAMRGGAKGDGIDNDTAAFEDIIGAAEQSSGLETPPSRGRQIFLPNGTYLVDSINMLFSGLAIWGESRGGVIVKLSGASQKGFTMPSQTAGNQITHLSLRNLIIDMSDLDDDPESAAIFLRNTWAADICNVIVKGQPTNAHSLYIGVDAYTSSIKNSKLQSIKIRGTNGTLRSIQHTFDNVDAYHFDLRFCSLITVKNSAIQGNYAEKFLVSTVSGLNVSDCDIENGPGGTTGCIYRGSADSIVEKGNILAGSNLTEGYAVVEDLGDGAYGFLNCEFANQFEARVDDAGPGENGRYTCRWGTGIGGVPAFMYDRLLNMVALRLKGTITNTALEERSHGHERLQTVAYANKASMTSGVTLQVGDPGDNIVLDGGLYEISGWAFFEASAAGASYFAIAINETIDVGNIVSNEGNSNRTSGDMTGTTAFRMNITPYRYAVVAGGSKTLKLQAFSLFASGTMKVWGQLRVVRI